ncbi:MAG: hypothetical protein D6796_13880, partial [Caldilineae bacterium]
TPVTVVQGNPTVAGVVGDTFAGFTHRLYDDPRLRLVVDDPRSFLRRTSRSFDLILLPLTDSFHPVTAGAYTLSEDYRYTVEAFADALAHLSPGGVLLAERWLQLPPSESLRLWGTALAAARRFGGEGEVAERVFALRSLQTSLVGVARAPLTAAEAATVRRFAASRQFDLVYLPGMRPEEANRFSVVPEAAYHRAFTDLLAAPDPDAFFAAYPYDVTPPTDDRPFFFHFFRWRQTPEILQSLGRTWQPFGGSGYLVLAALLALAVLLSAGLIVLPLAVWRRRGNGDGAGRGARVRFLLYFALLGLGFLFVEIPLLQRFILYLGQPAYAFAVVVSALLVASGVGSGLLSRRVSLRIALPAIVALAVGMPFLLPSLFRATLAFPFAGRVAVTALALFPPGALMGIPFPRGLARVAAESPGLVPWVWAVNGCASVVASVLAAMLALGWGFSAVLWGAALCYALAGATLAQDAF